ncbi:MAG: tetratricopeptide repeat protein [Nitrospirae bacterium]|nr:tetratricopeptide repeat protein [Nitrospirota bacterium]MBU6482068.1 tetratricopeptide repeat protein [Nitrospirota bacterium]MDE3218447.1 tetratricopeptide repeat protein [Nitrospirota bacterium]
MEQPMSTFDHYKRGRVLKQSHTFAEALEEFRQAVTDPLYGGKARVQMALCLRAMERYDEAAAAFRQALELATFSSEETTRILYLLGKTLESVGQYAEALEAYGWARKEDPGFQDVAHRIKHLLSGGRGPLPPYQQDDQSWVEAMRRRGQQLTPQILSLLDQLWKSVGGYAERLGTNRGGRRESPSVRDAGHQSGHRELTPTRGSLPASRDRKRDNRQHVRVAVQLHSHFSSRGQMMAGEGELRDLSPGGCRVTSPVAVPVGVMLECCIFPQGAINPFTIEGAMVRWSRPQEFGVAFTTIRPGVQRQIAQLCRQRIPLG